MQPHVIEFGGRADTPPGLLKVDKMPSSLLSANHVGIAFYAGNGLEQGERGCVQVDGLPSRLAVGKQQAFVFLANVLPAQCQDFVPTCP